MQFGQQAPLTLTVPLFMQLPVGMGGELQTSGDANCTKYVVVVRHHMYARLLH